ncbi:MAG: hypothetical protein IT531_16710 [Burkholderiales bacterium]|nr:hypothetical protein [Burkholderiales bacterium]
MNRINALKRAALAGAVLVALGTTGSALAAAGTHDHGESHAVLKLNQGKKWATDAALRQGMDRIRASLASRLDAAHRDQLKPAQYKALADEVTRQVAYIVQNCKLEPAADAVLHVVIADMMAAADAMSGKDKTTTARAGFVKAVDALDAYNAHFEHPRFQALKH